MKQGREVESIERGLQAKGCGVPRPKGEGGYWSNYKWGTWSLGSGRGSYRRPGQGGGRTLVLGVLKATGRSLDLVLRAAGGSRGVLAGEGHSATCLWSSVLLPGGEWVGGEGGLQLCWWLRGGIAGIRTERAELGGSASKGFGGVSVSDWGGCVGCVRSGAFKERWGPAADGVCARCPLGSGAAMAAPTLSPRPEVDL